ncbi:exonuclease domain-containing protein [Amycolatopsis dongchuanensis]|uniref:3'-5' exonuclease n=1 Tax=Amycolatopsis dongchuanensis TaxID=1070866 RepID=A0ABP9Q8W5_9PSEU
MASLDTPRLTPDGRFPAATAEFTALDVRTTGLRPGHVVEVAAVRVRADGTTVAEFATLVNPGWHVAPGPAPLHRISRRELDRAPEFREVLGPLLDLCHGSVVVAHNLPFLREFLAAEVARLEVELPPLPAVCTLDAARQVLGLPNVLLSTVAVALGLGEFPAHLALAHARTVAAVASSLVTTHGLLFTAPPSYPPLPRLPASGHLFPRGEAAVREQVWLADLTARLRLSEREPRHEAYRQALTAAVADVDFTPDDAAELTTVAMDGGIPAGRAHLEFVTALREVAEEDGALAEAEAADLTALAKMLGVPEAVGELRHAQHPEPRRLLVLGETQESDALRAAALAAGIQLARELAPSVTHIALTDDVPRHDPRLTEARDLGIAVLDLGSAWPALGLLDPAATAPLARPLSAPRTLPAAHVWAARGLMAAGLAVMLFSLLTLVAGAPLASSAALAVLGVAALCTGWYLSEPMVR